MDRKALFALICAGILAISMGAFAASSPGRAEISLGGNKYLQVRGMDYPHGVKTFKSWPGYASFVHSNCYHVHGEYKVRDKYTGREILSKGVVVPLYCKGAWKFVKQAFKGVSGEIGTSASMLGRFVPYMVVINPQYFQQLYCKTISSGECYTYESY